MAMSVICGGVGAAPIHGGFVTFDFDQAAHAAFAMAVGVGAGAPTGCCMALTIEWFHNWDHLNQGYSFWVGPNGGGNAGVLGYTVAVHGPPGPWNTNVGAIMAGLGMPGFGLLSPSNCRAVMPAIGGNLLSVNILTKKRIFVVVSGGGASHVVGILRTGNTAYFFDANHGEAYFNTLQECTGWLVQNLLPNVYGAMATVHLMAV